MGAKSSTDASPVAMIATLGGKPQVVTFALDALFKGGIPVSRLNVVHLSASDPRVERSLSVLQTDLRRTYGARAPRFESVAVTADPPLPARGTYGALRGRPIERIDDPAAAQAVWMTLHRLVCTLRAEGCLIHLCVTGGPRLLALQAVSVANMMLTPQDRCWHLYTPEALREAAGEGRILHEPDSVRLIPVPLLPLGLFVPGLQQAAYQSPDQIIAAGHRWLSARDERCCGEVIERLTPRQRDVLREFARGARSVAEVARRLSVSVATVNTHKTVIFDQCRAAWGVAEGERMDFHFLREHFGMMRDEGWGR